MTNTKTGTCAVPARHSLALLTSAGVAVLYMLRINMSVAIVAMAHTPTPTSGNSNTTTHAHTTAYCVSYNQENQTILMEETLKGKKTAGADNSTLPEDYLTEEDPLTNKIPGGRLAELYGTKRVFGGAILIGGVLTLFTPLAARAHYVVLILLRAAIGLAHGVVYPSLNTMVARWIPPLERPRFMSFTYMSNTLGTIITMPLCGMIIAEVGWPAVFYVTGGVSLVWVVVWALFMHDSPDQHPKISLEERSYILHAIQDGTTHNKPSRTPWRSILTSVPLWATHVAHIGSMFGFNLLLTQLPTYMSSILGFSIKTNGLLSAIPFVTQFLGSILSGMWVTWLLTHKYMTVFTSRRIFSTISLVLPGIVLVIVGYVGCDITLAVALFPVSTAFSGAICSGHLANHLDLAPNFAGTILGVSNTLAYMVSICVPVIVGAMTPHQNLKEWQAVFWLTAVMYVSSWMVFTVFGSTEIQPWNYSTVVEQQQQQPTGKETKFLKPEKNPQVVASDSQAEA
ncbi:Sialin-like 5 [Homarus americanus]|uniref:Sialin-like 5 n=1 Tax=Homarus americanus TaxID=6706 RepID=A0A8J5JLT3_HOMAM|nr:Sialin-like 5 [Homarus americanus]